MRRANSACSAVGSKEINPSPPAPLSRARERGSLTGRSDHVESSRQIARDDIGWDPNDSVPQLLQIVISLGVVLTLMLVNHTVNLHNQTSLRAEEIDNVRTDWVLAPEAPSSDLPPSQHRPELLLCRRCTPALIAGRLSQPEMVRLSDLVVAHSMPTALRGYALNIQLDSPLPRTGEGVGG